MKRLRFIYFLCLLSLQAFAQNYAIEKKGMDDIAADYAEEIIQKYTPSDNRHYTYTLTQNNKEFVISCTVTPGDINVMEQTDDIWNEMEATVIRTIKRVTQSPSHVQQQPSSAVTENLATQQTANTPTIESAQQPTQQITQNYANNYQISPNDNMGYMYARSCTVEDARSGKAAIGEKICFSDGSCGVIFLLDGNGHGLAISLDEAEIKWQNAKRIKDCQDIYQLVNEKEPPKYCNIGLGSQQTQMIINQLGSGHAPAAEWCTRHGNGWYLPSAGELWYLFTVANSDTNNEGKSKSEDGFISKMLQMVGGHPIGNSWYWSSSEEDQENAWNVSTSGKYSTEDKNNDVSVRAIRYF